MIRRPPRSTLFPYTTPSDLQQRRDHAGRLLRDDAVPGLGRPPRDQPERCLLLLPGGRPGDVRRRSEEHTSELQSRFDLVCRLLLEKKKKDGMSTGTYKKLKR